MSNVEIRRKTEARIPKKNSRRVGSDFEFRISRTAGVVGERAFVDERLARLNAAFDGEVGVGKTVSRTA
jgi:hypothetical protein